MGNKKWKNKRKINLSLRNDKELFELSFFTYRNNFKVSGSLNATRVVHSHALEHPRVGANETENFQIVPGEETEIILNYPSRSISSRLTHLQFAYNRSV